MVDLYLPALVAAFLITVVEMTEVVALVFALSADQTSIRHGALGAIAGTLVIALVALGFGAILLALPRMWLLTGSAFALSAFAVFLFRSTLKSYRKAHAPPNAPGPAQRGQLVFAAGFSVGAVEATEAVIVLIAISAAGYGLEAIVGALSAGAILVTAAALVHERIRRIKVPLLKLGATGALFSFAVFWGGEAAGVPWPGSDLVLLPLFVLGVVLVRGGVWVLEKRSLPLHAKG